jgi:hypothetical protein
MLPRNSNTGATSGLSGSPTNSFTPSPIAIRSSSSLIRVARSYSSSFGVLPLRQPKLCEAPLPVDARLYRRTAHRFQRTAHAAKCVSHPRHRFAHAQDAPDQEHPALKAAPDRTCFLGRSVSPLSKRNTRKLLRWPQTAPRNTA